MCQRSAGFTRAGAPGAADLDARRAENRSSNVLRGFRDRHAVTFEAPDGIALAIGAFDAAEEIAPTIQWGIEAKLPYVDTLSRLPGEPTEADAEASYLADLINYQHPDHDTDTWPPEGRR